MQNNRNKISSLKAGFTLIESIISLLILSVVILATLSVITRKKPESLQTKNFNGGYLCIHAMNSYGEADDDTTLGITFDHTRKVKKVVDYTDSESCEFSFDRRYSPYYIISVGAKQDIFEGEIKTGYLEADDISFDSLYELYPGKIIRYEDESTTNKIEYGTSYLKGKLLTGSDSKIAVAKGGAEYYNKNGIPQYRDDDYYPIKDSEVCTCTTSDCTCKLENSPSRGIYQAHLSIDGAASKTVTCKLSNKDISEKLYNCTDTDDSSREYKIYIRTNNYVKTNELKETNSNSEKLQVVNFLKSMPNRFLYSTPVKFLINYYIDPKSFGYKDGNVTYKNPGQITYELNMPNVSIKDNVKEKLPRSGAVLILW